MGRGRRAIRVAGWVVAGVVALVLLAAGGALLYLHTDPGRDYLRRTAERMLDERVRGDVSIGRITGSVLDRFTAHDVVVRDPAGEAVIRLDELVVDFDPLALLGRRFAASEIIARGLDVNAEQRPDGTLDLAELWVVEPPAEPTAEPADADGWEVVIDALRVERGELALHRPGGEDVTLGGVDGRAALTTAGGDLDVAIERLSGHWRERQLPFELQGELARDGERIAVARAELDAGDSSVRVRDARFDAATGEAQGELSARIAPADVRKLGQPAWQAELEVDGRLARGGRGEPLAVDLRGRLAGAPITAAATVTGLDGAAPALDAELAVFAVDPRAVLATAPAGEVTASLELDVTGVELASARGTAELRVHGEVADAPIRSLDVDAQLEDRVVRAQLAADALGGTARGDATVHLRGERIDVAADVTARSLRYQQVRVRRVDLELGLDGLPDRITGRATVRARGVRRAGERVGALYARASFSDGGDRITGVVRAGDRGAPYWARARVVADRDGARTAITAPELRIGTRAITWTGALAVVLGPGDTVRVERARLASPAGRIEASGVLRGGGRGTVAVTVDGLALARVRRALPETLQLPAVRGRVGVRAEARLAPGAITRLEASGAVSRLAWQPDQPAVSGVFEVELERRQLQVRARAVSPGLGAVAVELAADTPRRTLDPAAWRGVSRHAIDQLVVDLERVDLARVAALLPEPPDLQGTVGGRAVVRAGADALAADLTVRGLRGGRLRRPIRIDVRGDGSADRVEGAVEISLDEQPILVANGTVHAGVQSLWRAPERVADAPLSASVRVPRMPVRQVVRLLGGKGAYRGDVRAAVEVAGTLDAPSGRLELVARGAGTRDVSFQTLVASGRFDRRSWSAKLHGTQDRGGSVMLDARGETRDPSTATGRLRAERLQLQALNPVLASTTTALGGVGGRLDADIAVSGGFADPDARGWLRVRDGRARFRQTIRDLRDLTVALRFERDRFELDAAARSGPGRIELALRGALDGIMPTSFTGRVETDRLPFVAGGAKLALDTDTRIRAETRAELLQVWLTADEDTFLHLPKRLTRRELHETGPLEDVVYVSGLGADPGDQEVAGGVPDVRIHLTTPRGFRVKGDGDLDARMTADVTVRRIKGVAALTGNVEVLHGEVDLFGREYDIDRAIVSFAGDVPPDPSLNVVVTHTFDRLTMYVQVHGTLKEPRIELTSDPAIYSREELLGFVLGGTPGEPAAEGGLTEGATAAASALVAGKLESMVASRIPFDTVQLGTEEGGTLSDVAVGKWLTEQLYVAYRRRFEPELDENANEAELEYRFRPRWVLEGVFGDRGHGSVDLMWVKRFDR